MRVEKILENLQFIDICNYYYLAHCSNSTPDNKDIKGTFIKMLSKFSKINEQQKQNKFVVQ